VSLHSLTIRSCVYLTSDLTKIDRRLLIYFSAVALLHVALKITRNGLSDTLMDMLSKILGRTLISQSRSHLCLRITELNTSELVELLQQTAVERLTTYRQAMARDFGSLATIVTTDFEALYAYKRGECQRCLLWSVDAVEC